MGVSNVEMAPPLPGPCHTAECRRPGLNRATEKTRLCETSAFRSESGNGIYVMQAQERVQLLSTADRTRTWVAHKDPLAGEPLPVPLPRQFLRAVPTSGRGCWGQAGVFRKLLVT